MKTRLISFVSKSVDENKVNFIGVKTHGCSKSKVKIIVWSNILDIIILKAPEAEPHIGCCIFRFCGIFIITDTALGKPVEVGYFVSNLDSPLCLI